MKNSTLVVRLAIFVIAFLGIFGLVSIIIPDGAMGAVIVVLSMLFLVVFLFPVFNEPLYDQWFKKQQAIKKLVEVVTEWGDSHYHPDENEKTDPGLIEMDLTLPSHREQTQWLLDSLIAERARKAMKAFNDKLLAENELGEVSRRLKRLDSRLVGSMTRKEIQTPLDDLKKLGREAAAAKSEYHNLRKLVRDAEFKVWENIECYLALKIN